MNSNNYYRRPSRRRKRRRSFSIDSHSHDQRQRSRHDDNEQREQAYRSRHHYHPYRNHQPTQRHATNPTPRHVASHTQSFDNHSRHLHHESTPVVASDEPSNIRQQNELTSESTVPMTTRIHSHSASSLLADLVHRLIDSHAASYNDHPEPSRSSPASIDLIAYAWTPTNPEIFLLPDIFSIQFSDLFDLNIPDEIPAAGLTDSELENIPTMIYKKSISDDKCTVCLNEYQTGEKLKSLKCRHYFHSECIDPWLKTSTRCPVCRGEQSN